MLLFRLRKLVAISGNGLWRRALLRWGVAAGTEHARVLGHIGQISTVVDIGANRGQFALVARRCFPAARIISFEPLPGPAEVFRKLFAADHGTVLRQVAIGPRSGEARMHVSARDDSSSLLPISAEQELIFPGTRSVGTASVEIAPLSEHIPAADLAGPSLLKIDVQGFELEALDGCGPLLERMDWVYVECSFRVLYEGQATADQVVAWLQDRRFLLSGVYNSSFDRAGRAVQADFLFRATGKR